MRLFSLLDTQYTRFSQAVKSYLSKTLSSSDAAYGNNTIFGQMINVLQGAIQNVMLYIEDSLTEQNKYTAQRKKSIYGLAALSGYNPSYGKAAGVQLKLSFTTTNNQANNVIINNHETLTCTQNGLRYNIILPQEAIVLSIDKDNSSRFIYAVEGRFESQTFLSTGGQYYTQNFKFLGNLDVDYMEVRVNDEVWEQRASLYDMDASGKQYTYKVSNVSGIDLIFGNEQFGKALKNGDVIKVTYLIHDGEVANLNTDLETYFVFDNNLMTMTGEEVDGNSMFNITFAIKDPVTSGSNSESINQVRQMIGLNTRSLVLANSDNYKNLINKFSFCGYNRTWSEPGSLLINSLIIKNYGLNLKSGLDYFNLREKDFLLTDMQKKSVISHIEKSGCQVAGATYNIIDPEIWKYALYIYVKLKGNKYDVDHVKNKIRVLVGEFFMNINNDMFIPKSDIIHLIKSNIEEVDSVTCYFLSERNESAIKKNFYINTYYSYDTQLGTYAKKEERVYVYPGENPNLGLDQHGNILLNGDNQFPALLGGWSFSNDDSDLNLTNITDPLIITIE